MKYTYIQVKEKFEKEGFVLLSDTYQNCKEQLLYRDINGYKYCTTLDHFVNRGHSARMCHSLNPYSIDNINNFAELNNIESRCIDTKYINSKTRMSFMCGCGKIFYTTKNNFLSLHKIKCDNCTGYNNNLTYQDVKNNLKKVGFILDIKEENFTGITKCDLFCHDIEGYKYKIKYDSVMRGRIPDRFNSGNPFTIDNINHFLKSTNTPFKCISDKYINSIRPLEFICKRCNEHVFRAWRDINKNDNHNRHKIICPNCDGRIESVHALVLKQMFKHYYPDTIEEEKSCRNPITNKIMPTDIVNHRLKIAIEIQSEWHDNEYSKIKDTIKKNFWIDKGYSFHDPDIRDYSVLEICQLFFDIEELPDYINYNYSNKINVKEIQSMLDEYITIPQISNILNINIHRIYDALYSGKITRPKGYSNADLRPIVQINLDGKYVNEYVSISEASKITGIKSCAIASAFTRNNHYSSGFYWFDKDDYYKGNYKIIETRFSKFMIKIDKYDKNNNYICSYDNIPEASKELGTSNYSIFQVVTGERKSIKGFIFKRAS